MKLSTRSRYGTRILVDLARNKDKGPIQIGEISKRQDISVKYLEQLIRPLKKAKLVTSVRGPKGCVSYPEKCPMSDDCQVRLAWRDATEVLYKKLDSTTISDLMNGNYAGDD
jgi:DNA-binding IscR family transcriptional regulator